MLIHMARPRHDLTLSKESTEYLKKFDNKSKIVDEAIELHKVRDKLVLKPVRAEVIRVL